MPFISLAPWGGDANLLATGDSDLLLLGSTYEGESIVNWRDLEDELLKRNLAT